MADLPSEDVEVVVAVGLPNENVGGCEIVDPAGVVVGEPKDDDFVKRELPVVEGCDVLRKEKLPAFGLDADLSGDVCIASSTGAKVDLFFGASSEFTAD